VQQSEAIRPSGYEPGPENRLRRNSAHLRKQVSGASLKKVIHHVQVFCQKLTHKTDTNKRRKGRQSLLFVVFLD